MIMGNTDRSNRLAILVILSEIANSMCEDRHQYEAWRWTGPESFIHR